jgi:8-oxo-dGTP diphosphatase
MAASLPASRDLLVAAAVILRDGEVLLARRGAGVHLEHYWEFPGGKVEEGESPQEALRRELMEELGVVTTVEAPFAFNWHDYGRKRVLLLTFTVTIVEGDPRPIGCSELAWCGAEAVRKLTLPPADGPILERLLPLLA